MTQHSGQGWADRPENRRAIRLVLYAACTLLFAADVLFHRHIVHPAEAVPGFYAVYGFVALVGVVLGAKLLRRFVKRDEKYYER
jgi:hypothetical protein